MLRKNTEYTLTSESKFDDCEKRWILNRIFNETEKSHILVLLKSFGYTDAQIVDIPFDKSIALRERQNSTEIVLNPILSHRKSPFSDIQALGQKIRDFTQLNQARNEAIRRGIESGFRWIMCFDGNQFIPDFTWKIIQENARKSEVFKGSELQYIEVPMIRLKEPQQPSWMNARSSMDDLIAHSEHRMEEGQIIFRNDSRERFNENMAYSLAPKQDLLDRTCSFHSKTCICHSTVWSWLVKKESSMKHRMLSCGATVRLFNYPEKEGVMKKIGNGNERRDKRIMSVRRFVDRVEALRN